MRLQGMDQNSFFVDAIDREAIKVELMPTIKTSFLVMALRQKLYKPSFKVMLTIPHFVKLVP